MMDRDGGQILLEFSILASGSSGNALYIRTPQVKLLLDAGISGRQLQQRMQHITGDGFEALDAVLFTHEHIDHVRGLPQLAKSTHADFYATEGTWSQLKVDPKTANTRHQVRAGESFTIGDITVTPFAISHDAEEPVAYRFDAGSASLAVITDLGYVSDAIKNTIQGCQCFVFEANHDVDMLRAGRYPWNVKRRILGDKGHLSNHDAAVALSEILTTDPVDVYLAHLSEETNQPDLAELTVHSVLREIRDSYADQVRLRRTSRAVSTALHALP